MDIPLPWERVLWSRRPLLAPGVRYVLTDFRIVRVAGARSAELAIQDVGDVCRERSVLDRLVGTSTLVVHARDARRPPVVLRHVRRGAQIAALLEFLAGDPDASLDATAVRAALAWEPRTGARGSRGVAAAAAALVALLMAAMSLKGTTAAIAYPPDDAIYPRGEKRDHAAIVAFMETEVLPWARATIGPLKGGADNVSCATCHGEHADERGWRMPAVAALPEPDFKLLGWELYSAGMDSQMRNAIYGYVAESENQARAAYMREFVLPGMARLLHRPAYDFTKTYEYNRTRLAFGCYHCHLVK